MRFLLALFLLVIPACTISYYGTEDVQTEPSPTEPDVADAAISPG